MGSVIPGCTGNSITDGAADVAVATGTRGKGPKCRLGSGAEIGLRVCRRRMARRVKAFMGVSRRHLGSLTPVVLTRA